MMRVNFTYECGCLVTLDLDPGGNTPDRELRPCHAHGLLAARAGHPPRRPLSVTYDEEGGGEA